MLRRFRTRVVTGLACMIAVIPLTLAFIPAGVLAWFVGVCALGLAGGRLVHDEIALGAPPVALPNDRRRALELMAFVVLVGAIVANAGGTILLMRHSAWAKERIMSQVRELSPE